MSEKKLYARIQHKHDIEANWLKATNFVPLDGELIIYDPDDNHLSPRFKVGDGQTAISLLPFTLDEYYGPCTKSGNIVTHNCLDGWAARPITYIMPVQEGEGDPSPENVRPISGWDAAMVMGTGKNMLPFPVKGVGINSATGIETVDEKMATTPYIPWDGDTTLILSGCPVTLNNFVYFYDAEKNAIGRTSGGTGERYPTRLIRAGDKLNNSALTTGARYFRLAVYTIVGSDLGPIDDIDGAQIQLEVGETATAYEPYQGQTLSADLPETVYGGTLDWKTGVLTVTMGMLELSKDTTMNLVATKNGVNRWRIDPTNYNGRLAKEETISLSNVLIYKSYGEYSVYLGDNTNHYVYFPESMDSTAVKEWFDIYHPQICYELNVPYTIQLTPQQLDTIKGVNNIWSDTGETEVAFGHDVLATPEMHGLMSAADKTKFDGVDSYATSIPFVVGTQTATTGTWTGTTSELSSLVDGQTIRYWLPYNGSGNATLNLTLSGGTTTGAKNLYYKGTSRLTTHFQAGSLILLTYRENVSIAGSSATYTGWWAQADYDSNNYDRIRYQQAIKCGTTAIVAGNIIVGNNGVYQHLKSGAAFDVTYPILYANSAIAASGTGLDNYLVRSLTITTTQSITLTAYKPVFIKGSLSGTTFTPVSTTPITQTVPTTADGYEYILLGVAYNTTSIYLLSEHPIFAYKGGAFGQISSRGITDLSASGKTITYTRGDGTTGTITTQDTVYTHPTTTGNKHIPSGGSSGQVLCWAADGTATWGTASTTASYTHPTTSGNKHIPSGGSSGQILRWSADGTATWGTDNNTTYDPATTSANGLMSAADKTKLNATNIAYATCSTAAATAAKVITISGNTNWTLSAGSVIVVKFSATNTAQNPTFNVNSTGAKSVWYNTAVLTTGNLSYAGTANRPMIYVYDGTQYVFLGWSYDANTTYSNASLGQGYATCTTAAATVAKVATLSNYALTTGGVVAVKFSYDVPTSATLNINSKGAKPIYNRGTAIVAGVIKAGDTATFMYNGSQYHLISIDRQDAGAYRIGVVIPASGWTKAGTGRYTNTVTVDGVTSNSHCYSVDIDLSNATESSILGIRKAWSLVDKVETASNGIVLTAFNGAPSIDFNIMLDVVSSITTTINASGVSF